MKKFVSCALTGAMVMGLAAIPAAAADVPTDLVYGTMQIPYTQFYAAEGSFESVDVVSSATESKWQNPELVAGSYSAAHTEDNGGDIVGVVYPVAISAQDLEALGEDNYAFEPSGEVPAAYKLVTVADGVAQFSEVQGETAPVEAGVKFSTESKYGDYQIDVDAINNSGGTSDIGTIYGVVLTTADGSTYALRHLENIWQDKLAWSSGVKTVESHGNTLNPAQYEDIMGKTISTITYITGSGYHTLDAGEIYVPIKFESTVEVAAAAAADGSASLTLTGFPEDYSAEYAVDGLEDIAVNDDTLTWDNAFAGAYTLTISDASGVYADVLADFVLTTAENPVAYDAQAKALVAADGAEDAAVAAYLANLNTVTVNGNEYAASGKRAVKVITEDGSVDPEAAIVEGRGEDATSTPVFGESGDYEIIVSATGYDTDLVFTYTVE